MDSVTGYLLTRHWRDGAGGVDLDLWAWSESGPLRLRFPDQRAVCFIRRDRDLPLSVNCERKALALADLEGNPVDAIYFRQQQDLTRLRGMASGGSLPLCESEIKPADRFLMERFITAAFQASGETRQHDGYREMINPRIRPVELQPSPRYLSIDIETDVGSGEILSIGCSSHETALVLMQGQEEDWPGDGAISWFIDEPALLRGFLAQLVGQDPDLLLGWNLINFDLETLQRRFQHHGIPFHIGRGGETAAILQPRQSGQPRIAAIPGRVALDGIDSLRAAFWSFESFSLERVARELLGRGKLIDETGDKIAEIRRLFREDRRALAAYNLQDCRLVEEIFAETGLIDFALQRATMTGLPLGRQGGSVAAFDNLYLPRLHRAGRVAFDIGARQFDTASPGGYVMNSRPGLYDNVLLLDFKSLYPSIIRTFRIDPLGLAEPGEEPVPGFLGANFSRRQSILPEIIGELWQRRDLAKQRRDLPLSQAIKIIMNSFYGVLGSSGCRFFDPKLASSITRRGHQIIIESRDWLEAKGFTVIYGDTDSLFVLLGTGHGESESIATGQQLAARLNRWWQQRLASEFDLECFLEIEFETHFLRFLMPTIRGSETGSKKRYAGTVRNRQGELEVRFKGLESVRSDWTPLAREFQQQLYRRVFLRQPYHDYLRQTVDALNAGALDRQLVYRKRVRRRLEEYRHNVPPHIQAARKSHKRGRWISYLMTVNGPEPVDNRQSPIDYRHYIDRQLAPAADGILHFLDESFERLTADQMDLF
ncbi:MAG: DNA polymerase II [Gammaproteobacteria bacterium]|nr:DNA polymerase II [Gammaproteobacteria bacterium]